MARNALTDLSQRQKSRFCNITFADNQVPAAKPESSFRNTAYTAALAPESPSDQIDSLQASKTLQGESSHYRKFCQTVILARCVEAAYHVHHVMALISPGA